MKNIFASKKNIVILTAALLSCAVIGGATLALLTKASGTLTNSFTVGTIETHIDEKIDSTNMQKEPSVVNDGEADCLVRVKVTVTPSDAEDRLFTLDYQTDKWTLGSDGFYYYNSILEVGKSTTPLFTTVNWLKKTTDENGNTVNDYSNFEEFDIIVYQEAVQAHVGDVTDATEIWAAYNAQTETAETTESTTESESAAE